MTINLFLSSLRDKGYLAYEYNPFHNYQTDVDLYTVTYKGATYIIPKGKAVNPKNGEILDNTTIGDDSYWTDKNNRIIENAVAWNADDYALWASAGSLIDFETDQLNFDLNHPVDIEVLPSYDGSVNLIINDDKNIPRLINSRFSVREKGTYEIVDRIGENDTNIYNSKTFDKDTSLYFQYEYNPTIKYVGQIKGVLPVGSYCFYFTYCDADDNESDYIAETGLIPVFIGSDRDPYSIDGGIKNQTSNKGVRLQLTNLDKSYNYLKVYYVRYFADYLQNRVSECKKIYLKYPINSSTLYLLVTGNELAEDMDANILNITRFNPKSILTQAQCKNMLFFGNIVKNSDNYKELLDCALRIIPELLTSKIEYSIDYPDGGYYDSLNMYNSVGYFNQEYYRFGVVFIYLNGTLSNVYNTLGTDLTETPVKYNGKLYYNVDDIMLKRNYIAIDEYGWVKNEDNIFKEGINLNARGVCKINTSGVNDMETIIGIKFNVPKEVSEHLKTIGIRGLFFVRQKCIPNILAQCYLLNMDELLEAPVISYTEDDGKIKHITECFLNVNSGEIVNNYTNRIYNYTEDNDSSISEYAYAGICPDFLLNLPYYNQIFNSAKFNILKISSGAELKRDGREYKVNSDNITISNNNDKIKVTICTVTEDVPSVAIKDKVYKLEMGATEEAYRFKYAEKDTGTYSAGSTKKLELFYNLVRGMYSPYLAIYSTSKLDVNELYNIFLEGIENVSTEYKIRMDSSEPFYAISDRYNFELLNESEDCKILTCWRGDCYINNFTYRLNRNFNDPTLPNNDEIIDANTWKDNYDPQNQEKWEDISRSDVNAVQMGSWITFKVRSAMNYALRSQDHSYVSEEALMGAPRSFYPRNQLMWRGANKLPDSYLYNDAYRASLGHKCYFTVKDINYIKDTFSNRILYSAISIQDSFKNNYRYSLSTYFRDYSLEYGSITKLVGFDGYLLVVFEHAIGVAVVNERILAGNGDGEPVFINTKNVLPEELTIISDTYGSQWTESIIKTESGMVYGVDTISKKIWRVKGQLIEILSDFKVGKFLIDNITLGEIETNPIIGLRNVKTHYNNNKKDVMFTFYDDVYKDQEKVWNLCYNEILDMFVTFYSWIPSYSENIDTQFFSFDRYSSKVLTLLGKCNYNIPENSGILVDSPVINWTTDNVNYDKDGKFISVEVAELYYRDNSESNEGYQTLVNDDGTTSIKRVVEITTPIKINFALEKDHWHNYKYFDIELSEIKVTETIDGEIKEVIVGYKNTLRATKDISELWKEENKKYILLLISAFYKNKKGDIITYPSETIVIANSDFIKPTIDASKENSLATDFYLHGQAGIFDVAEDTYPCWWYGKLHPFEFEVVVNDNVSTLKIFSNLVIISNKAEPESFHFEIEGDNYDFSMDKRAMYFRQEATKQLYQYLGSDILYNLKYTDVIANKYTEELWYRGNSVEYINNKYRPTTKYTDLSKEYPYEVYPIESNYLVLQEKSTIFPLYYLRIDTYEEIYHKYQLMMGDYYDFLNLTGSEVTWNRDLNLFNIVTHIKNSPIDRVGRMRGNSSYTEGKWTIQIPSISFMLKNEDPWNYNLSETTGFDYSSVIPIPPIVLTGLPDDVEYTQVPNYEILPNIYVGNYITNTNGWTLRKETRIRDKWMKVRIRYSGKNLAVIHSLITLYNLSA